MNSSVRSLALVVEDDQFQREVLGDLLKDENIEVIQCESAEAAELVIAKLGTELKLLVTDVRLAGPGSGIELAKVCPAALPSSSHRCCFGPRWVSATSERSLS